MALPGRLPLPVRSARSGLRIPRLHQLRNPVHVVQRFDHPGCLRRGHLQRPVNPAEVVVREHQRYVVRVVLGLFQTETLPEVPPAVLSLRPRNYFATCSADSGLLVVRSFVLRGFPPV